MGKDIMEAQLHCSVCAAWSNICDPVTRVRIPVRQDLPAQGECCMVQTRSGRTQAAPGAAQLRETSPAKAADTPPRPRPLVCWPLGCMQHAGSSGSIKSQVCTNLLMASSLGTNTWRGLFQ